MTQRSKRTLSNKYRENMKDAGIQGGGRGGNFRMGRVGKSAIIRLHKRKKREKSRGRIIPPKRKGPTT